MKKNLKLCTFITIVTVTLSLISIFPITNVNAAYAYSWTVDGEGLSRGSSNKLGNVTWSEDETYTGGVLTLNNYTGGQLKIDCYGTGLGHIFAVKLVGENKISVENGVGIIANAPIVFIGDGKLTIDASVPIGSGSIINDDYTGIDIENAKWSSQTTMTIEPKINNEIAVEEDTKINNESSEVINNNDNEVKKEEAKDKSLMDNSLFSIGILSYCVISLITIIILIIKLSTNKKVK